VFTFLLDGLSATHTCSTIGLDAKAIFHRVSGALLTARIPLGRLDGDVARRKLDLVQFPAGIAAQAGAGRRSDAGHAGARFSMAALLANSLTTCHTTRSVTPLAQVLPARQTHRNMRRSLTPADASQEPIAVLTQSGTRTVRICRALPTGSTIARRPSFTLSR
jgi:hypothetical protein